MTVPVRAHYHPTSLLWVPVLLCAGMFALLQLTGNSWFLLLSAAAVGAFALVVASREEITGLTIQAWSDPRVAVGQQLTYTLRISNGGARTSTPVSMLMHNDGLADVTAYIGPLRPGECVNFVAPCLALQRGVRRHIRIELFSSASLGLIRAHLNRVWTYQPDHFIHPALLEVDRPRPTTGRSADSGTAASRGTGTEIYGAREWQRGDDHRHVHWRSTARHGRLVVLERGETRAPAVRLLLVGPSSEDGFEAALSTAAGLCDKELHAGEPVTVAAWLADGLALAPTGSRVELLDWWAALVDVTVPDAVAFPAAAIAVFGTGDLIVAGPSATLDQWLPEVGPACDPLVLGRLGAGR